MQSNKQKKKIAPLLWAGLALLAVIILIALLQGLPKGGENAAVETLPVEVSVEQASQMRESGAFVLDVREQSEWDEVHIPGSTLIPLAQLESRLSEVPKDQEVVVVCRSGNRSKTGRDTLLNAGYKTVTSMAGGIKDWQASGLPTVSGP
jgi:rhodanese-related sulfurtransferase